MGSLRRARRAFACVGFALAALCGSLSAARANCDNNVWGVNNGGKAYTFLPPTAAAAVAPNAPTFPYGTIARGIYSGELYIVGSAGANDALTAYNPTTNTQATVGRFTNTSFLYASAFGPDGLGYAMSSSEVFSFTDTATPTITRLGPPATTSGPAITAFNSGDIAVDQTNTGWVILSNNTTGLSYLYQITFGTTTTTLARSAQITLGGRAYTTADLYSLAFGVDGNLYTSSGGTGTLYQVSETTGALTTEGAQGVALLDFASCPFLPLTTITKVGPSKTAVGELLSYSISVTNSGSAHVSATGLTLTDPLPTGTTPVLETCTVTGGAVCGTPTVNGQTVTAVISSLPAGSVATLTIHAKDVSLATGTTTNTASISSTFGTFASASAATTVLANIFTKTVANLTEGIAAGTTVNAKPNDVLQYTLSYTNYTNAPVYGFAMHDTVPANNTYVASTAACATGLPTGVTCTPSGPTSGVLTWTFSGNPIPASATVSVSFNASVN